MTTIKTLENRQVIDYLARDYDSFRQALLDLIPAKLPEWTDRSEADFGIVLIELFAYMADILGYYQDRIANEAFLTTAQERRSVINHLRLIGYELAPAAPAAARLSLIVGDNVNKMVEIRKGDQFATASSKDRKSVTFEYVDEKPLVIDLSGAKIVPAQKPDGAPLPGFKEVVGIIPVLEGRTISNEVLGESEGTANQRFKLAQPGVLPETLEILVGDSPVPWRRRKNLILSRRAFSPEQLAAMEQDGRIGSTLAFSRSPDQDFATETDQNDVTLVVFGDGQYGKIPPPGARIRASYRVGGGQIGNVGAGQITIIAKSAQLQLLGAKVVNRQAASGGAERESIEHAIKFAPSVFTSMQRAVTANDYVALAKLFPGVSKARAEVANWNVVKLFIAPAGSGEPPSDILRQKLLEYFEDKRMLTTLIQIESPDYVRIDVTARIGAKPFFRNEEVKGEVEAVIRSLFEFEKVDFKQTLYLSKIYEAVESLPGVDNVYVERFQQSVEGDEVFAAPLGATGEIAENGLIPLGENQIPILGKLTVAVTGGV